MTKGNRTVAGLLAVIAVLLALNLIVKGVPQAVASAANVGPSTPTLVGGQAFQESVWRFWSDGMVDLTKFEFVGTQPSCDIVYHCSTTVIPGTCMSDVDRDGNVATSDLLEVLEGWGECE